MSITVTVRNATELKNALAAARGGETILLAPGVYSDVVIQNRAFTAPVQLTSLDPNNPAKIASMNVINSSKVTFTGLHMGYELPAGTPDWAKMISVSKSSYITFDGISFYGSLDGNPGNDADGLSILNSDQIKLLNSSFTELKHAAMFGSTTNIEVVNNKFFGTRFGGVHFADVQHVKVASNHFTDFSINPGDHPDAIQFWETGTTKPSRDILIVDNVILQGKGSSAQGIVFGNNVTSFDYEDVRILNNLVYSSAYNGILIDGAQRVQIEGNTIVSATTENIIHRIYVLNTTDAVIRGNVTDLIIQERNVGLQMSHNIVLRDQPSMVSQIPDINAGAAATVEGLTIPKLGYQIPSTPVPSDPPRYGGSGNDGFYLGATLDPTDRIIGREGRDQVAIQGNYPNLVLGARTLTDVEALSILTGSDTRFGDTAGNSYDYNITSVDENVGAGVTMTVNANRLRVGEDLRFDGSAEKDGAFIFYPGHGRNEIFGGAGNDAFFFGDGQFSSDDRINGGGGRDQVAFRGNYASGIVFEAHTITDVEGVSLMSGHDTRYGLWSDFFHYNLTVHDQNVAAGQTLTVNAGQLHAGETLVFNGSAETDGHLRVLGGRGNDALTGGACADWFYGGLGADRLTGGLGADLFQYRAVAESTGTGFDQLIGFDCREDTIDLPIDRAGFTRSHNGSLSGASLDSDLAAALAGVLGAGEAVLFTATAGDFAGRLFGVVDGNNVAGYQAGEDYLFEFVNPVTPIPLGTDIFV